MSVSGLTPSDMKAKKGKSEGSQKGIRNFLKKSYLSKWGPPVIKTKIKELRSLQ